MHPHSIASHALSTAESLPYTGTLVQAEDAGAGDTNGAECHVGLIPHKRQNLGLSTIMERSIVQQHDSH